MEQCRLTGVSRSGLYYAPVGESAENMAASVGRAVYANPVLRDSADDLVVGDARSAGQCETGSATAPANGIGSDLSQTADLSMPSPGTPDLPVSDGRNWRLSCRFGSSGHDGGGFMVAHGLAQATCGVVQVSTTMDSGVLRVGLDWAVTQHPRFSTRDQERAVHQRCLHARLEDLAASRSAWTAGGGSCDASSSESELKYAPTWAALCRSREF